MSIQIIDGFQVNTASPIDNRIVASGSTARNAIPYKYEGLRIFDTSDSIPYVWLNGTWVSENASGVAGSGTTTNYIPKLTGTNIIGNSVIYQSGSNIGVNITSPVAITGETNVFHVNGGIRANKFVGDGALIGSMSAVNITTGYLSLSRITNGPTNWVLTGSNLTSSPTYSNPSQMTVGTASVALTATTATTALTANSASVSSQVSVNGTDASATERYLTFVDTINVSPVNNTVKANTTLRFKPSTGQLLINSGAVATPGIGIIGTTNTGIYKYSTNGLGIAVAGAEKISFNTDGIRHVNTSFTNLGNFVVGTGNLSRTTQITIASATYDRVIYVYSSSNSNNYYSTSGFFEIEIYIINGAVNQQIYTIFHGNDSDVRPTGLGYNYILPAGSSSTISLYKGNTLAWNTTSSPTIYATSLKFGL